MFCSAQASSWLVLRCGDPIGVAALVTLSEIPYGRGLIVSRCGV